MDNTPYRTWACDCGFHDNRNTDLSCQKCGKGITCKQAGGHSSVSAPAGQPHPCIRCGKNLGY